MKPKKTNIKKFYNIRQRYTKLAVYSIIFIIAVMFAVANEVPGAAWGIVIATGVILFEIYYINKYRRIQWHRID